MYRGRGYQIVWSRNFHPPAKAVESVPFGQRIKAPMSSVEANDRGGRDAGMGLEQQVPIVDTWAGQPISLRSCRMFAASTVDRGFSVRRCSFSRRFGERPRLGTQSGWSCQSCGDVIVPKAFGLVRADNSLGSKSSKRVQCGEPTSVLLSFSGCCS
jgi:hypothetical protein